jgi:hypothetical protein
MDWEKVATQLQKEAEECFTMHRHGGDNFYLISGLILKAASNAIKAGVTKPNS